MDLFLYDRDLCHERVKIYFKKNIASLYNTLQESNILNYFVIGNTFLDVWLSILVDLRFRCPRREK